MTEDGWLERFVVESNKIEGIMRTAESEMQVCRDFLKLNLIVVNDMERFVHQIQPDAVLRNKVGLDVRVGAYVPPPGGFEIENKLHALLAQTFHRPNPYQTHIDYENLHPFTDGNGRSGRVLWLWMMLRGDSLNAESAKTLGFLHTFYYQTLRAADERR